MRTLFEDGMIKAIKGLTTLEEVMRITQHEQLAEPAKTEPPKAEPAKSAYGLGRGALDRDRGERGPCRAIAPIRLARSGLARSRNGRTSEPPRCVDDSRAVA